MNNERQRVSGEAFTANALTARVAIKQANKKAQNEVLRKAEALLSVKERTFIPLATGERRSSRHGFIEQNAVHVSQPDLCHCGGLSEAKKIAAHAETHYMGVAPQNPLGPVANAAALHFAFSTPNFLIQEDMLEDVPWRWEVAQSQLKTETANGCPARRRGWQSRWMKPPPRSLRSSRKSYRPSEPSPTMVRCSIGNHPTNR